MRWDDLRFFLELARSGRLMIAARRLGVEHTTVSRRIQALEVEAGVALFNRTSTGYELTEAGEALLPSARAMEEAYMQSERFFPHSYGSMEGLVRIGCNEGYGTTILPKHVSSLVEQYPDLAVELIAVPRAIQLPRQEADIAITIDRPARGPYKITRLADYRLGLFASDAYLNSHPPIRTQADLRGHRFISYIEALVLAKNVPTPDTVTMPGAQSLRSTSILAQRAAAEAGAGIAILPCYLVTSASPLRPILPKDVSFIRTYWMISQVDLFNLARVRTTWQHLRNAAEEERDLLVGGAALAPSPSPTIQDAKKTASSINH